MTEDLKHRHTTVFFDLYGTLLLNARPPFVLPVRYGGAGGQDFQMGLPCLTLAL